MFDSACSQYRTNPVLPIPSEVLSPSTISYQSCPQGRLARQTLIFENTPAISKATMGKGIALVELADGRVFFFRTSMGVMMAGVSMDSLLKELNKLPAWVKSWRGAAEIVGYAIGAPLEFVEGDPGMLETWNIQSWKQHAASKLAINNNNYSIQQISSSVTEAAKEIEVELSERIDDFMRALGQSINDQYGHLHCSWQSAYNYFTPDDRRKRLYRRQANQIFPLFVQQIFLSPDDNLTGLIIRAIDDGVPLVDFLSSSFNCPKKCIRRLKGVGIEEVGIRWKGRIKELVNILAGLDVNRLPKSEHEWDVFGETIHLLSKIIKLPVTSLSSRMLLSDLSKLHWDKKIDISASLEERALAIERFVEGIRIAIIATAWVNGKDCSHAGGVLYRLASEAARSMGLSRLEKLARKWRSEELRLDTESCLQPRNGFPVLLKEPLEFGDLKILQLTDPSQLDLEGRRMSNCVGSYTGQCASGRVFIFSIRDKSGASCVTIEYQFGRSSAGLPELLLVQQRGKGNSIPSDKYHGALELLQSFVRSTQIRKKLLDVLIYQKLADRGGAGVADKYIRSLKFIEFLEQEAVGRFDFRKLIESAL